VVLSCWCENWACNS